MSQPPGASPPFIQNPKSILADRTQYRANYSAVVRTNDPNNLRVTFAQAILGRRSNNSSATSLVKGQTPPGSAGSQSSGRSGKFHYTNIYKLGNRVPKTVPIQVKAERPKKDGKSPVATATPKTTENELKPKNVSVLYPSPGQQQTITTKLASNSSSGVLLAKNKPATANARQARKGPVKPVTAGKGKSAPAPHQTKVSRPTRSVANSIVRRVKSGKKLKSKKKSKTAQQDPDLQSVEPPRVDDEYASELHKITQILKAVSNFDEASGTGEQEVYTASASKSYTVSHYTYQDTSKSPVVTAAASKSFTGTSSTQVRRPLSGEELKQLLSSITRVVSLHQLPTNASSPSSKSASGSASAVSSQITGLKSATPPATAQPTSQAGQASFSSAEKKALLLEAALATVVGSASKGKKFKKKKSRKFTFTKTPTQAKKSGVVTSKSEGGSGGAATSGGSKSTDYLRSRTKSKPSRHQVARPHSDGSVSSTEKDPLRNALFLKKYFDESTRLANKKSSDLLLVEEAETTEEKPKKRRLRKKKSTSASHKSSSKTVPGTSHTRNS